MTSAKAFDMSILRSPVWGPVALSALVLSLDGCRVVTGIFKAGVWVGIVAVFVVIGLALWVIRAVAR